MNERKRENPWKVGFCILAIAVLLWVGYAVTVPRLAMSWEKSNQFGGMFGGIGALFSGLALVGVVVAIMMQKEELELQREELVATREELHRTAEAQQRSSQAMREQAEILLVTARLNGMSSLVQYHSDARIGDQDRARKYEADNAALLFEMEPAVRRILQRPFAKEMLGRD